MGLGSDRYESSPIALEPDSPGPGRLTCLPTFGPQTCQMAELLSSSKRAGDDFVLIYSGWSYCLVHGLGAHMSPGIGRWCRRLKGAGRGPGSRWPSPLPHGGASRPVTADRVFTKQIETVSYFKRNALLSKILRRPNKIYLGAKQHSPSLHPLIESYPLTS